MVSGARDTVWRRRARSAFRESVNGNGAVKQIGNTTLGGPAVVLTVGTTSVEDMAVGHEGRMDLGAALAADDGARSGNSIRGNSNNRSSSLSSSRPHLSP